MLDAPGRNGALAIIKMDIHRSGFVLSLGLLSYLTVIFYRLLAAPKDR